MKERLNHPMWGLYAPVRWELCMKTKIIYVAWVVPFYTLNFLYENVSGQLTKISIILCSGTFSPVHSSPETSKSLGDTKQ